MTANARSSPLSGAGPIPPLDGRVLVLCVGVKLALHLATAGRYVLIANDALLKPGSSGPGAATTD